MSVHPATRSSRNGRLLLGFLALALALRLPGPLNSGLWFDEIWLLVESIRGPLQPLLTTFENDNSHPLFSVMAWASVRIFGEHAWSLRLPALVFGVASVGMLWRLALEVGPRSEAVLVTLLLTVSYHHIWFSQNARGYTLLLFWTLAATYFLIRTYGGRSRFAWIAYGGCLALATFTHASAALIGLAHGVVGLLGLVTPSVGDERGPRRASVEALWGLFLAGALSVALHAGMLGEMVDFFRQSGGAGAASDPESEWTSLWWTVSAVIESLGVPRSVGYVGLTGGMLLVGVGATVCFRRDWRHALLFVLPPVMAVVATVAMGRSLRPRFLFPFAGFALIIVVAGVFFLVSWIAERLPGDVERRRGGLRVAAGGAMVVASLVILPRAYTLPKQDFEGAMRYVEVARRPGDSVVTVGLTILPYRDYFDTDYVPVESVAELERVVQGGGRTFLLHTIPIYLDTTAPELAIRIGEFAEVARYRGSLGGGDVVVLLADDGP